MVSRALPRHLRPSTISCWRRTAFSASSRAVDLNGETKMAKANQRSPITRSAYAIRPPPQWNEVFGTHSHSCRQRHILSEDSDISLSFQHASKDRITVLVANSGLRPGTVSSGKLTMNQPKEKKFINLIIADLKQGAQIIKPGESLLIDLIPDPFQEKKTNLLETSVACTVQVGGTNFSGKDYAYEEARGCYPFEQFLTEYTYRK